MLPTRKATQNKLPASLDLLPTAPLYKRAPRKDENGNALSDFMMIIPKLRHKPETLIRETIRRIERVLADHANEVVFADLNLKLNVLWVVVKPLPGICWNLPVEINDAVPEALLVAHRPC